MTESDDDRKFERVPGSRFKQVPSFAEHLEGEPWTAYDSVMDYVPLSQHIMRTFRVLHQVAAYRVKGDVVSMARVVDERRTPLGPFDAQELLKLADPDSNYLNEILDLIGGHLTAYATAIGQHQNTENLVRLLEEGTGITELVRNGEVRPEDFRIGVVSPMTSQALPLSFASLSNLDNILLGLQQDLIESGQMTVRTWSPNLGLPYQIYTTQIVTPPCEPEPEPGNKYAWLEGS